MWQNNKLSADSEFDLLSPSQDRPTLNERVALAWPGVLIKTYYTFCWWQNREWPSLTLKGVPHNQTYNQSKFHSTWPQNWLKNVNCWKDIFQIQILHSNYHSNKTSSFKHLLFCFNSASIVKMPRITIFIDTRCYIFEVTHDELLYNVTNNKLSADKFDWVVHKFHSLWIQTNTECEATIGNLNSNIVVPYQNKAVWIILTSFLILCRQSSFSALGPW